MKILTFFLILSLFALLSHSSSVEEITEQHLADIKASQKIWLVYSPANADDQNIRILHDASIILTGFYKIGILPPSGKGQLHIYADDGQTIEFSGDFNVDTLVDFALSNTDSVLKSRSKLADDVKSANDFKKKEK